MMFFYNINKKEDIYIFYKEFESNYIFTLEKLNYEYNKFDKEKIMNLAIKLF